MQNAMNLQYFYLLYLSIRANNSISFDKDHYLPVRWDGPFDTHTGKGFCPPLTFFVNIFRGFVRSPLFFNSCLKINGAPFAAKIKTRRNMFFLVLRLQIQDRRFSPN